MKDFKKSLHVFRGFQWQMMMKYLSDLKITVVSLFLLFVLTFIGTLYQVDYGLYAAQQRYFYSWFLLLFSVVPFPGAKTVLIVLTINLIAASLTRYPFKPSKYGILMIHYGIIFLLVASFITHYFVKESYVALDEGTGTGSSFDYYESELSVWREILDEAGHVKREVLAFDASDILPGKPIVFSEYGVELIPEYYYAHARPADFGEPDVVSTSKLTALEYAKPPLEREQILPGGVFQLRTTFSQLTNAETKDFLETNNPKIQKILLWEADPHPYILNSPTGPIFLRLQRKRYPLPFIVKLDDFIKEEYFGTAIAKSFESRIQILRGATTQESRIYMNNPLRTDNYTFFQASFAQGNQGKERSILAVVYNTGYWVPYVASLIIVGGLIFHFLYRLIARIRKT